MAQNPPAAQDLKTDAPVLRLFDFSGGLRLDKYDAQLEPHELRELDGFEVPVAGALRKEQGWVPYNATSLGEGGILGMHRHLNGTTPQLLVAHGSSIYLGDDSLGTFTPVYSSMTPGYQTYFDTWKGFAFIVNGFDRPLKWNGTKVQTMENAPMGAKFVVHYADRLFMPVGDDDVRFSELLDPDTWHDPETGITNNIDVETGDDQEITGIYATQTKLVILKSRSYYYIRGYLPEEWEKDKISGDIGCIAPRSLVEIDGKIFFLTGDRGVYIDDGNSFIPISTPVMDILQKCTPSELKTAVGSRTRWKYRLDIPDHPDGPVRLTFDVRTQKWSYRTMPFKVAAFAAFDVAGDTGDRVVGRADQGIVYYERGGSFNGAAITSSMKTKRFGYAEPDYQIYLRNLIVDIGLAPGDTGVIRWFFNGEPVAADSRPLVDGINRFSLPPTTTLGDDIAFEVEISGTGEGSELRGIVARTIPRRRRWV